MTLNFPVKELMNVGPVVAKTSNKFSQVLRLFNEYPVHHLPIVDDDNKLIGIISTNDLPKVLVSLLNRTEKLSMQQDALDKAISLADIMTENPISIKSNDTVQAAAKIFSSKRFQSLPVVDNGKLVGIITVRDIMGYIAQQ